VSFDALPPLKDSFCYCADKPTQAQLGNPEFSGMVDGFFPDNGISDKEYQIRNSIGSEVNSSERNDRELEVLQECEYSLRYDPVGNTTRTRRMVI